MDCYLTLSSVREVVLDRLLSAVLSGLVPVTSIRNFLHVNAISYCGQDNTTARTMMVKMTASWSARLRPNRS